MEFLPPQDYQPDFGGLALAIDTETTGLDVPQGDRAYIVSMCNENAQEWLWEWPVNPFTRQVRIPKKDIADINKIIRQHDIPVFHNAKFDIDHLEIIGVIFPKKIHTRTQDTVLMSHVLDSKFSHELKDLADRFLGISNLDEKEFVKAVHHVHRTNRKYGWAPNRSAKEDGWMLKHLDKTNKLAQTYAALDAERTIRLYLLFRELLAKDKLLHFYERERKLLFHVHDMQRTGISIYLPAVVPELNRFQEISASSERALQQTAAEFGMEDFNPRSPKQLPELLYEHLRFPIVKQTPTGAPSTDKEALKHLREIFLDDEDNEFSETVTNLSNLRQSGKAAEYLREYAARSVRIRRSRYATLHPSLNQTGTSTTRFSSQRPNGQNISGKEEMPLRAVFSPPPGYLWLDLDYSNIELRIFAWLANEESLKDAFLQGRSVHMVICQALFGPGITTEDPRYKRTKNGNFSIIYGAGEQRADATYGLEGAYKKIRKLFPGLKRVTDQCYLDVDKQGYVETLFGYRLYCESGHAGLNYKIQGTAGDVMKYGMLNIGQHIDPKDAQMILTVHDELILQIPRRHYKKSLRDQIIRCMEAPGKLLNIPTPVSASLIIDNWNAKVDA